MRHLRIALTCFVLALVFQASAAFGQAPARAPDLAKILSFELEPKGDFPGGWGGSRPGTIFVDDKVVHNGQRSVRIERKADSPNPFSTMTLSFPVDFAGKAIQLRAFVRTEDVSEFVGLWMREDAGSKFVAFDNMQNQNVHGTNDWKEYSITLPVRGEAEQLVFGFLLAGTGKAWVSGMQLLVDGKPIWEAPKTAADSGLAKILSFENEHTGSTPADNWFVNPPGTVFWDDKTVHSGQWSVRFERQAGSGNSFSVLGMSVPWKYAGATIEMRGFLRAEDVSDHVGLWMREDGEDSEQLHLENMESQQIKGTRDWAEYKITLPVAPETRQLFFGVLLSGTGKAWADDLQLLVDGKPIWEAPKAVPPKTAVDLDHEFDKGSNIAPTELSAVQIQSLATLGKVWGFLKYNHPLITSGQRHWDYDLFRVLPAILPARDRATANAALLKWIDDLGPVGPCDPCAKLVESDLHLRPELDWISDKAMLGADLSQRLRAIQSKRPAVKKQFYIKAVPHVGNPSFEHELAYPAVPLPDAGFQLLGLYRFWNMIAYWYPYRNVLGEDWNKILTEFIPRVALAKDKGSYRLAMLAFVAKIHDTHANLWSSLDARPPVGACQLPVNVRFIENRPVIVSYAGEAGAATGLQAGDVITDLDGVAVSKLVESWLPYYAASNEPTQLRDIAGSMTNGACGKTTIRIRRVNQAMEIAADRVPASQLKSKARWHDVPGDTFRLLSPEVAYLKLSSVKAEDAAHYIESAAGTKGLIMDIRNYPSAFMVFGLGGFLVEKETEFVRFTTGDLSNPGAFHWETPLTLQSEKPHYTGKVLILVDEVTQSSAEYTTMAFRTALQAKVLGSTTAGADGNVSQIPLPGGLSSMISGIGVFYPDKKPTQRIGILPDVEVRPTIAGIRAGRDEVLEAAIRQILGPAVPAAQIEKMAKP